MSPPGIHGFLLKKSANLVRPSIANIYEEIYYIDVYIFILIKAFDEAKAEGWFIGEMIWNFAGLKFNNNAWLK